MIVIYSDDNCPKCSELKKKFEAQGIIYSERDASRIRKPEDAIDQEAFVQLSMQNNELPVVVEW